MKYITSTKHNYKNQRNLQLNEDFFDTFGYDDDDTSSIVPDDNLDSMSSIDSMLGNLNSKRSESSGLNLVEYKTKIEEWLRSHGFKGVVSSSNRYQAERISYASYAPVAVINDDGTVDAYGPVVIANLKEFPEYLYFNRIYTTDSNIIGNFTVRNCKFESIPEGFPEEVDGNYSLCKMPNLKSLMNVAGRIDGTLELILCNNLTDLTNEIKKLGKAVYCIGKNDISTEDVLSASVFKPNRKVNELVNEAIVYRNFNTLNEAFNSGILRKLFSIPGNKNAAAAIKNIPVLWSELPDYSIIPCYGLDRIFKLRRETEDTNYGLTILCDKDNVIKFIVTGNDKSRMWKGKKYLYIAPGEYDKIRYRTKLLKIAQAGSYSYSQEDKEKAIAELKSLRISKDEPYEYDILSNGDDTKYLKLSTLKLVPEDCVKGYILKSHSSKLGNYEFSYTGDREKVRTIKAERLRSIIGTYITNTKNSVNSPLYKKYANRLIDANTVKKLNASRYDDEFIIPVIEELKETLINGAEKVRRRIIKFYNEKTIDGKVLDLLYAKFMSCSLQGILNSCDSEIEEIKGKLKYKNEPKSDYSAVYDENDPYLYKNKLKVTYDETESSSYRRLNCIQAIFKALRKFALILSALEAYEYGDTTSFSPEKIDALFKNQNM